MSASCDPIEFRDNINNFFPDINSGLECINALAIEDGSKEAIDMTCCGEEYK